MHSRVSAEAERRLCDGDALAAAQIAGAALAADANDHEAHLVCAEAVALLGDKKAARDALVRLARTIAESGELFLALAAVLKARELGAATAEILMDLAAVYGAGSSRLRERTGPAGPPPVPRDIEPELAPGEPDAVRAEAIQEMARASDGAELARELGEPRPVPPAAIFSHLDPEAFVELARALRVRRYAAGATIVEQGAPGTSFWLVANGEVNVERRGGPETGESTAAHIARLGPGALFGEMAILSQAPRSASVVAAVPVVLLEAEREAIEGAAVTVPRVGEEVVEHCRRRMLQNLLQLSPILRRLDPDRRAEVLRNFDVVVVARGKVLIREGDPPDGLYLVVSGEVEVVRDEKGERLVIARLGPGEVVGEISLVLRRPATATVTAIHPTTVLHLAGGRFLDVVRENAELLAALYEIAVKREAETMSILSAEAESAEGLLL